MGVEEVYCLACVSCSRGSMKARTSASQRSSAWPSSPSMRPWMSCGKGWVDAERAWVGMIWAGWAGQLGQFHGAVGSRCELVRLCWTKVESLSRVRVCKCGAVQ